MHDWTKTWQVARMTWVEATLHLILLLRCWQDADTMLPIKFLIFFESLVEAIQDFRILDTIYWICCIPKASPIPYYTGWWFQIFFLSSPPCTWGKWSNLTNIFPIGLKPPTSIPYVKLLYDNLTYHKVPFRAHQILVPRQRPHELVTFRQKLKRWSAKSNEWRILWGTNHIVQEL